MAPALPSFLWTFTFWLLQWTPFSFYCFQEDFYIITHIWRISCFQFLSSYTYSLIVSILFWGSLLIFSFSLLLFLCLVARPPALFAPGLYWSGVITWPHWVFYFLLLHLTDCLSELSFCLFYFSSLFQISSCSFPLSLILSSTGRLKCLRYLKTPPGDS